MLNTNNLFETTFFSEILKISNMPGISHIVFKIKEKWIRLFLFLKLKTADIYGVSKISEKRRF